MEESLEENGGGTVGPGLKRLRVVGGLLRRGDRILLTRRPEGRSHAGRWEFPGGKVQDGESDAQALERELLEELGITTRHFREYMVLEHRYPEFVIELVILECDLDTQEPSCLEVAEWRWVDAHRLLEFELTPADVPVAERLVQEAGHAWPREGAGLDSRDTSP